MVDITVYQPEETIAVEINMIRVRESVTELSKDAQLQTFYKAEEIATLQREAQNNKVEVEAMTVKHATMSATRQAVQDKLEEQASQRASTESEAKKPQIENTKLQEEREGQLSQRVAAKGEANMLQTSNMKLSEDNTKLRNLTVNHSTIDEIQDHRFEEMQGALAAVDPDYLERIESLRPFEEQLFDVFLSQVLLELDSEANAA